MAPRPQPKPVPPEPTPDGETEVAVPRMSPSLSHFAPAFVRVQAQIQPVVKRNLNPHFNNEFADLASILNEALPILTDNGFALMQFPSTERGQLALLSMLIHESGQFVSATMPLLLQKADPQGEGSALTYGRRYAACAILGIRTVDDDGNGAVAPPRAPDRQPRKREEPAPEADWFVEHGWSGQAEHDEARSEIAAAVAALPEEAKPALKAWLKDQTDAPKWSDPWPKAYTRAVSDRVKALSLPASPGEDDEKAPSAPQTPDPAPEAESPAPDLGPCRWCEKPGTLLAPLTQYPDAGLMHAECHQEWKADDVDNRV